jgi:hypothetical protein
MVETNHPSQLPNDDKSNAMRQALGHPTQNLCNIIFSALALKTTEKLDLIRS